MRYQIWKWGVIFTDNVSYKLEKSSESDRNPGCGTTNRSDGKIIITPHLITIHLSSTMGCNFTQLSDPIRSD
jgi:hypothetical protein